MELTIRRIRPCDIEALVELQNENFTQPWSEHHFEDLLHKDYCHYLVALVGEQVVGFAGFADICMEGNIDNVVVSKEYRRQGIAKRLLVELMAHGADFGVSIFTLEVRVSNQAAIALYESLGFVSEGIRPGFYDKPKEDAMIMWLR